MKILVVDMRMQTTTRTMRRIRSKLADEKEFLGVGQPLAYKCGHSGMNNVLNKDMEHKYKGKLISDIA